jgi:uncharacterized protein (TIRG00374 family)
MKRWQLVIGFLISLIFLYFALRGQRLEEVWATVKSADYIWLLPGVAIYFVGVWVRAWRWHYLLRPIKAVPTGKMFPIVTIGYMGNNIFPYRIGEVLRAVVLKRREGVAVSASMATVIVERIFDGVVMLGFIFLNLSEISRLTGGSDFMGGLSIQYIALGGTILFLGALGVLILAAIFPGRTSRLVGWINRHLVPHRFQDKVFEVSTRFLSGLEALRSPQDVLMVLVTSTLIWLLETGKYWFVLHAFGLQGQVSFFALMLMNGIVNLATTLPSAPGYIGTFDGPGIAVLVAYGVEPTVATSYTLVLHGALWLPITLLGGYYFLKEGIRWSSISGKESTLASSGEAPVG